MKTLPFVKMVGTGNDFVVLDLRRARARIRLATLAKLARRICHRPYAVGADGLLTIEPSRRANVKMRVVNPDGSAAGMCGNGARCVAWYVCRDTRKRRVTIETQAGVLEAFLASPGHVRITLPSPSPERAVLLHGLPPACRQVYAVDTGVPHAVVFVPDVRRVPVEAWGRNIRRHRLFSPAGTNVDFVEVKNRHTLSIRTYERGVEAETLACGTGAAAAGVVSIAAGRCRSPIGVCTRSGKQLTVRFDPDTRGQSTLSLEGEVQWAFEGTWMP